MAASDILRDIGGVGGILAVLGVAGDKLLTLLAKREETRREKVRKDAEREAAEDAARIAENAKDRDARRRADEDSQSFPLNVAKREADRADKATHGLHDCLEQAAQAREAAGRAEAAAEAAKREADMIRAEHAKCPGMFEAMRSTTEDQAETIGQLTRAVADLATKLSRHTSEPPIAAE